MNADNISAFFDDWASNFTDNTQSENVTVVPTVIRGSKQIADGICSHFFMGPRSRNVSPAIDWVRSIEFHILLPTIAVLGFVGNAINLIVLRSFTGRTFFYLFWLAVSDLGTMIFDSLFSLSFSIAPTNSLMAFLQCHMVPAGAGISLTCSNFIVVVLTVDRFRAVCYPIETRAKENNSRPRLKVLLCFVSALVVFGPNTYRRRVEAVVFDLGERSTMTTLCYVCQRRRFSNNTLITFYRILLAVFSKIIPVMIVATVNISIVVGLTRHQSERSANLHLGPLRQETAEDRLKKLILTITTIFVICLVPIAFRQLYYRQEPNTLGFAVFKALSLVMIHLNTACNFYVYCFYSEAIRNQLRKISGHLLNTAKKNLTRTTTILSSTSPSTPSSPGTPDTAISFISFDPSVDSKL
ncbi:probable G-protein coupled receptor AH9.1 [Galendromus occidentalis]|uniref:Probable G-protein coupled receptor AH9.1 n=1 Tax=Galendromus occidentalis TaxID=34638 RepID=A0AAJ6QYK8_9ACAR|nr:probable G-protein coupled receptor AH9.1 [Galendromus occidentalis]